MRCPPLAVIVLTLSACGTADDIAFSRAKAACKVPAFKYERVPNRLKNSTGVWSPFRLFGLWWLDRRDREREHVRRYVTDIPIAMGGITDQGMKTRMSANAGFDCLQRSLQRSGIAISSDNIVLHVE
jgi:hypothetical protein